MQLHLTSEVLVIDCSVCSGSEEHGVSVLCGFLSGLRLKPGEPEDGGLHGELCGPPVLPPVLGRHSDSGLRASCSRWTLLLCFPCCCYPTQPLLLLPLFPATSSWSLAPPSLSSALLWPWVLQEYLKLSDVYKMYGSALTAHSSSSTATLHCLSLAASPALSSEVEFPTVTPLSPSSLVLSHSSSFPHPHTSLSPSPLFLYFTRSLSSLSLSLTHLSHPSLSYSPPSSSRSLSPSQYT